MLPLRPKTDKGSVPEDLTSKYFGFKPLLTSQESLYHLYSARDSGGDCLIRTLNTTSSKYKKFASELTTIFVQEHLYLVAKASSSVSCSPEELKLKDFAVEFNPTRGTLKMGYVVPGYFVLSGGVAANSYNPNTAQQNQPAMKSAEDVNIESLLRDVAAELHFIRSQLSYYLAVDKLDISTCELKQCKITGHYYVGDWCNLFNDKMDSTVTPDGNNPQDQTSNLVYDLGKRALRAAGVEEDYLAPLKPSTLNQIHAAMLEAIVQRLRETKETDNTISLVKEVLCREQSNRIGLKELAKTSNMSKSLPLTHSASVDSGRKETDAQQSVRSEPDRELNITDWDRPLVSQRRPETSQHRVPSQLDRDPIVVTREESKTSNTTTTVGSNTLGTVLVLGQ